MTLQETDIVDAINDGGPYESARNKMFALDFAFVVGAQKSSPPGSASDWQASP